MNKLSHRFCSSLITLLFIAAFACEPGQAQRERRPFDPDGSFWIHGQVPTEFSDFSGINLNRKRARHLPKAGVDQINGRKFSYQSLSVKRDRFTFTTVTVRGVSYSFEGRFLKGGVYQQDSLDDEIPVLEGELKKFVGGKKVAQARLKFIYFGGT